MSRLDELKKKNSGAVYESRLEQLKKRSNSSTPTDHSDFDLFVIDYENMAKSGYDEKTASDLKSRLSDLRVKYNLNRQNLSEGEKKLESYLNKVKYSLEGNSIDYETYSSGKYDDLKSAEDFKENSGYVSTKSDKWWSGLTSEYGMRYDDLTYEYINNQDGLRDEIKSKYRTYTRDNAFADLESNYEQKGYDFLTKEEVDVYNYYYATEGKDKAQEFLDSIQNELVERKAGKTFEALEGETLKEIFYGVVTGVDQFRQGVKNIIPYLTGDEGFISAEQVLGEKIRKDLADDGFKILGNSVGQIAYDLTNTTANMLPSILVGAATGGVGGALTLGASATGNAYAEMRSLGYDDGQARTYATLVGASEATLQYALGGISKLGGKVTNSAISKFVSGLDNALVRGAIQYGGSMASEGLEESIQTVLEPAFKALATGEEYEAAEWEEILYSGLLGALSAGVLEGRGAVKGTVKTALYNREMGKLYGDQSQQIIDDALSVENNSELRSLAEKYKGRVEGGKNLKGAQINRLIEATDTTKVKNAVLQRLGELGETGDVTPLADALVKQAIGDELTLREKKLLNDNNNAHIIAAEMNEDNIMSGGLGNKWAESIGTRRIKPESYNKELYDFAKQMAGVREAEEKDSVAKTIAESETATGTKFETSESGKTTYTDAKGNTEYVTVKKVVSTDGGLKVKLSNGETVSASDVSFGTEVETIMYEMVASMDTTPNTANVILNAIKPTTVNQAAMYKATIPLAYRYGTINHESGLKFINLPKSVKSFVYKQGMEDAKAKVKTETKSKASNHKGETSTNKKEIIYENGFTYDESTADEIQKVSMAHIEVINQISNLKVHVFKSFVKDGKRVFYLNGELQPAPNGYFKDGNKIYIDFNAGNGGEGAMLYIMSHEVTHYIREHNAKGFKELADFLIEQYGNHKVNVNGLIEDQKDKIKRRYERERKALPSDGKLFDMAYEEMVADAMSDMLTDPKAYEKLAKLKEQNHSLWKTIGDAIKNLLNKLKGALGIYKEKNIAVAEEALHVRDFSPDVYEKLQDLYIKAFVEADLLQMEAQLEDSDGAERRLLENNISIYKDHINNMQNGVGNDVVWSMDIPDSMKESVLYEGQVLYSDRTDIVDVNGKEYDHVIELDYKTFNKVKRNGTAYIDFIRNNLINKKITVYNSEGESEIIEFAKTNERVKKDGSDNFRRVLGELEQVRNPIKKLVITNAEEVAEISQIANHNPTSNHQWLDANGWDERTSYVLTKEGIIYPVVLHIAKTKDGRNILYDANVKIKEGISIDKNATSLRAKKNAEQAVKVPKPSDGLYHKDEDLSRGTEEKRSDRDSNAVSNRTLLANALESVAQNDIEKNKLAQYKAKIALIESEQKKLNEIRAKANEIRFTKGRTPAETKTMHDLDAEATQIANRISTWDKQLLNLEATTAIKNVLEREKAMLRKKLEQKSKQALKEQRQKDAATTRELLTRYQESREKAIEGRHKTEMRHKIKNVVSDLNKLLLNPTKDQHVPIGLQLPVAEALDAINMDTMNAGERVAYYNDLIAKSSDPDEIAMLTKKRDFFEYRDANFKERITALKNAYAEFKESDDPLIRNAHNDAIEDLIKNTADAVGNKSLKDMSMAQLEAVYNMYKAILATVRNSNKMFKEGRQETVTENSEAVKTEVKEVGGHKERVLKLAKFFKKFGWDMLKPVTAMKVVGSKTFAKLFDNVRAAEDTWAVDVNEAKQFYEGVSDKYGYKKWDFKKRYSFKDSTGTDFSLSLEQIMSLYAYSKREQADNHLEFGGFIFDDAIEVTEKKLGIPLKYEVNDANPYRLRKEDLLAITDALTKEQKAFTDEMVTYLSDVMGEKGNEVSLAMYDIKLYNEKTYFPLKTSRYFREFDPEKSGTPKIKNSGFSKKTVPQAGNPIVLSNFMDVWASHVNDMSMYHAFVLPLEDFLRVYNYSSTAGGYDSVQQYIKNAYGSQANQYIEKLMDDLNGGARVDSSAGVINKGLSLFKKASVFASASVVVQQPSAIARAFAYINPKYFVTSAPSAMNLAKHKTLWAEVKKYAPVAVIKEMGYFDTGVGRSTVEWLKGNKTIKDKMDDVLSKAPAIADELAWTHIWEAVKKETADKHGFKVGSEDFLKESGRRFTEIITNTQVYDSVLSRSGMMRSKDTGMKMATAFMAEPTTTVNMMVDGIIQGKRGNKKFAAATVGAVSASIILNSILVALVYAARDDDEDETYTEKYIGSVTSELLDGFNPLTYVPFVKDIWSIAQGYDVERSDMSVVSNLWESIEGLFNEDKSGWEKVLDATGAVSSLFGIPLKNIIRDAKGMYNLTETVMSDTETTRGGIEDSIEDSFKSTIPKWDKIVDSDSKSDNLYDAIMSGDSVYIERLKKSYKTEDAYETAVRKALRENDSRIHEAAQARYDGDISAYTRIAKEIIAEGNFSQDTVVGAINAEISAIKRGESSESETTEDKDEVTSIYSGSDVNTAFDNGNDALALEIIDDLINTKVANGMDEKNAKSSVRSSMTSYWKPLYKQAYQSGDTTEMLRIRRILLSSGLYGTASDVVKTAKDWLKS